MQILDRAARRIERRASVQVGSLHFAWRFGPVIRKYNKRLDNRRVPLWWSRAWSRTLLRIGRARLKDWRDRQ
jgi:hypothetical protein